MRVGNWRSGSALLTAALVMACSGTPSPPPGGTGAGGGEGLGGAGGAGGEGAAACEMWAPRLVEPEVLIGPEGLRDRLVALIDGATESVELMMYQLDCAPCVDALIAAASRGVAVRVLLDGAQGVNAGAKAALGAAGVPTRDAPTELSHDHAKVLLVDHDEVVVMSANMNSYSFASERNYGVVDRDGQDVAQLLALFERDWAGEGAIDTSCTRLILSPLNARQRLLQLLGSATQTLDLAVMYVSDPEILNALEVVAGRGVQVRVLLAMPEWIDSNAATAATLAAAGIEVRYLYTHELHAKLIVADGVAFVGSENLSSTSLDENREVGLLVTEPTPRAAIQAQLAADWAAGVAAP
ncbi:MAG: phospholipase D-like domain-containing protein [Polyangiaceae bacterium]